MKKILGQGAESVIYLEQNSVVKDRVKKGYRIKEIDEKLRKFRTKREARVIEKLPVSKPKLIEVDNEKMQIKMEFLKGNLLRDILSHKNCLDLCEEIGEDVAKIHDAGIIHGDLTTSNIILSPVDAKNVQPGFLSPAASKGEKKIRHKGTKEGKIFFIDFGLSFFSEKIEDKAVDIHLFRQALESKHYKIWEKAFKAFLEGYKSNPQYNEIIKRLDKVESRGRYKGKG